MLISVRTLIKAVFLALLSSCVPSAWLYFFKLECGDRMPAWGDQAYGIGQAQKVNMLISPLRSFVYIFSAGFDIPISMLVNWE